MLTRYAAGRELSERPPPLDSGSDYLRRLAGLGAGPLYALLAIALLASAAGAASSPGRPSPYNPLLQPPFINGQPVKVAVQLHIANVAAISSVHQDFRVQAYLYETWRDPRLAYSPDSNSSGTAEYPFGKREYPLNGIWLPRLIIINAVEPRQIFGRTIHVTPEGVVHYIERFTVVASSRFELRSFPFDSQMLQVIMHPFTSERGDVVFVLKGSKNWMTSRFIDYSSLAQWNLKTLPPVVTNALLSTGGRISEIRFDLAIQRKSQFYIWKVCFPLLILVILSWTVFWIDASDLQSQIQVAVVTLLTVIAFSLAISATLPKVPYMTFIDVYFLVCYIFVFMSIIELMSVHVSHRLNHNYIGLRIRRVSRWLVPAAFCVSIAIVTACYI